MSLATILVVDDEELIRWSLVEHLQSEGYQVLEAEDGQDALDKIESTAPDLVLTDLKMPRLDGMGMLRQLRQRGVDLPVIMVTAHGAVDSALEATRLGARAYVTKPYDLREISVAVAKVLESYRLEHEVRVLRGARTQGYDRLIGTSPAMQRLFKVLRRLEEVDAPTVLLAGESGTGKDLIAHAIHSQGPRKAGPMMEVDCASLPENLIESELFGHERGAFTDARTMKRGRFEVARGGTLFLDEIGELPSTLQAKLLRALESRRFQRVGGVTDITLDASVVAASNRDLAQEVREGRFREDLYFRLNVIMIEVPPLRERREDVPLLVDHFVQRFNESFRRKVGGVSAEAMGLLQAYPWPGNVRELRNVVERIVILEAEDTIRAEHLPGEIRYSRPADRDVPFLLPEDGVDLEALERSLLSQAIERTDGNQSAAARLLGLTRYQLRYRLEKHGLVESSSD